MNEFPLTGHMFDVMLRCFCPDDINVLMQVIDFASYASFLVVKGIAVIVFKVRGRSRIRGADKLSLIH